ncbi:septal ring lytic transglycosylase RlpA family protein [Herminiimonas sp. NPDC097707]|uniref:septal ring lytic transglycosylase RlpA family protein n=1 Tax=Herminiimonas sp. NPDC097707 TaxID=3364007 RepID=UPI00383B7D1C
MQFNFTHKTGLLTLLCALALAGCSSVPLDSASTGKAAGKSKAGAHPVLPPAGSGRGGYYKDDGPGDVTPEGLLDTPDAEPRIEPYSTRGNKPYVVFGKRYVPMTDERPFKQQGRGSWYGKKFHGQKTSSGEPYDMYQMSAAHPTLPIPSYARVTNLSNGKQVIVRVNDRGPFHSSRVIDLSYTAALKLGYIGHGSASLEVERLLPADIEQILANKGSASSPAVAAEAVSAPAVETNALAAPVMPAAVAIEGNAGKTSAVPASGFYLQFGAYSQAANAEVVRARLAQNAGHLLPQLRVEPSNNLYRLYSGPFASRNEAAAAAVQVQEPVAKPFIVQR